MNEGRTATGDERAANEPEGLESLMRRELAAWEEAKAAIAKAKARALG